jgi:hypothetical protein
VTDSQDANCAWTEFHQENDEKKAIEGKSFRLSNVTVQAKKESKQANRSILRRVFLCALCGMEIIGPHELSKEKPLENAIDSAAVMGTPICSQNQRNRSKQGRSSLARSVL